MIFWVLGICIFFRVISIFPMARLTACYVKSIIYIMFSNVIREATIIIAKFNGIKVYHQEIFFGARCCILWHFAAIYTNYAIAVVVYGQCWLPQTARFAIKM